MHNSGAFAAAEGRGGEIQAARGLGALCLSDVVDNVKGAAAEGSHGSQLSQVAKPSLLKGSASKFKQLAKKAVVEDDTQKASSALVPPFLGYVRIHEKKYAYQIGQLSIMLREARGVFESVGKRLEAVRSGLDEANNLNQPNAHTHTQPMTALEASQSLKYIVDDIDEKSDWLFDSDLARAKFEQTYGMVSNPAKITASTTLAKAYEDVAEDAKDKHPHAVSTIATTVAGDLRYQAKISGGWENVLYKMDGTIDMQMPLDSWTDADKVEILSLMLQNSKQETAAATKKAGADKTALDEQIRLLEEQVSRLQEANISLFNKNMDEERQLAEDKVARLSMELGRLEEGVQQAVGLLREAAGTEVGGPAVSPTRGPSPTAAVTASLPSSPPSRARHARSRSPVTSCEVGLQQPVEDRGKPLDAKLRDSSVLAVSPKRSYESYVPVKVAHKPSSTPDMITFSKPAVLLEPLKRAASSRPSTTATRRKQKFGQDKIDALLMRQQAAVASRRFETTSSFSGSLPYASAAAARSMAFFDDDLFAQTFIDGSRVEELMKSLHSACQEVADRILYTGESGGESSAEMAPLVAGEAIVAGGSLQDTSSLPIEKIKASDILLRARIINQEISSHIQQSKRLDGMLKEITRNYQSARVDAAVGERRMLSRK